MDMNDGRTDFASVKLHVEELNEVLEPCQTLKRNNCTFKRSFRRAQKRAAIHGYTWYKGKLCTPSMLGTNFTGFSEDTLPNHNVSPKAANKRKRLTIFSWNAGGLPPSAWDYLQQWADLQDIDIICIQETHWPFTSEWQSAGYHILHSGEGSSRSGLLCMVSRKICSQHELAWNEIVPGRLVHMRIHGSSRHIDLISVYQHIFHSSRLDQRQEIWTKLSELLGQLSQRHNLIMLGDFNTSLTRQSDAVGVPTYLHHGERCRGTLHGDQHLFHNLLTVHALTTLNTWNFGLGPTYQFGHQHSRIDFICVRRHFSDNTSKQIQYLDDFPLICQQGASHIPQLCSVLKVWHQGHTAGTFGWSRAQRLELCRQWQTPDDRVAQFQHRVIQTVSNLQMTDHPMTTLHDSLNTFQPERQRSSTTPTHRHDLTPFQRFQAHHQALRALHGQSLHHLFQAWTHVTQKCKARQQMKITSAAARKRRLASIYQIAGEASRSRDHFRLYQAIRQLAPKQQYCRIQIRKVDGAIMTPGQEADALAHWFTELYQDTDSPPALPFAWPFSSSEFCAGLRSLPLRKALAPAYVPSPFWKLTAQQVSTYLDPALHEWSTNARFPQCWSDGTLVFLPKTKKRTQLPSELRPISLLEPCGKSVMGLCASRILECTWQELQRWPQFAYLPSRGVDEALHRILQHCRVVRTLIETHQFRTHMQAQGLARSQLCGGLTVSLDLSKAFDMVHRSQLLEGLSQFNIPYDIIELLKAIYHNTAFHFQHKGESRSFVTRRGIRQGCRAAPTLWAVFSVLMLRAIANQISFDWVLACVTLFADDGTFHQVIESEDGFHRAIKFIGIALDLIESFHMNVNVSKTVAVLRLVGSQTQRLNRKFLKRTADGTFLRIPRRNNGETLIQLVRHFQYPGASVSYHSFERITMDARIKASEKVGQQLHRWVYVRSSVPISLKLRLWKQCIFASLVHSLITVGFTRQSLQAFDVACMKQLRRIFRNPVHLTHLPRVAFLRKYGAEDPLLLLSDLNRAAELRDTQMRHCLDSQDVILHTAAKDFEAQSSLIWEVWHRRGASSDGVPDSSFVCPQCFQIYATLAALRRHLTCAHGTRSGPIHVLKPSDLHEGVPTCAHCHIRFTTKQSLQYHINYVCTADRKDLEQVEHRLRIQELLQVARSHQLQALADNAQLLAHFYTRCALCNTFCTTTTGLLQHWKMEHDQDFRRHEPYNTALLQTCIETNPCQFCGACFKRTHKCHIIRQVALLMVHHDIDMPINDVTSSLTCPYCQKVYTTRHGLQSHINVYHMAEQACESFQPEEVEMYCLIHQAMQTEEAEDLLSNPSIQHFMANTCLSCRKSFNRRNELKRHFRANHPSEWHEAERRAMIMDAQFKPHHGCVCHPSSHIKHICVFYIQYALLRLTFERQQMPQVVALPPDQLLGPEDYIEPLARLGHLQVLHKMSHLKYQLSTMCQVCGTAYDEAEALRLHLHADHSECLQEVQTLRELLVWSLFGDLGCFCNPSYGWGAANHECTSLIQLALVIHELRMQIVVPWAFNSTDVVHLLSDMMPLPSVQRIGLALMSRQFYRIWQDPILLRTLATRCLLCQEAVDLQCLHAHLRVFHQVEPERVWYMVQQLSQVYANLMMDGAHCEWCRELMPSYFQDDELLYDTEAHLQKCPMMSQLALLLMMPRWSKPMLPFHAWPRQEDIAENHRLLELRIWQHNAFAEHLQRTLRRGDLPIRGNGGNLLAGG